MTIQNKVALITGASRGLGLVLARELARNNWWLIINARGESALNDAQLELEQYTTVVALVGDITDTMHLSQLSEAVNKLGRLDLVVNNASTLGLSPQPHLLDYPIDVLESVFRTNVLAPLAILQTVQNYLTTNAKIINVTSDAGVEAYEGWGGYGASKAALEHLSAIFAVENSEYKVYWVDPGDMQTQMHQEAFPGEDISDRPLPEVSIPAFMQLVVGELPSGRYQAQSMLVKE